MSNEVVAFKTGGIPQTPDELVKGLQNVSSGIQASASGVPFMSLSRDGWYIYGPEKIEVEEGSRWAVNPYAIQHGFACWGDGELLGEVMVPHSQPLPSPRELPDHGRPWDAQVALQLQCVSGEDVGVAVVYKGTSRGLQTAAKDLIQDILTQVQRDSTNIVPVLELDVDSYNHRKYGKTYVPVLKIVDWVPMTGPTDAGEPDKGQETAGDESQTDGVSDTTAEASPPARRRRRRGEAAADDEKKDDAESSGGGSRRRRRRG